MSGPILALYWVLIALLGGFVVAETLGTLQLRLAVTPRACRLAPVPGMWRYWSVHCLLLGILVLVLWLLIEGARGQRGALGMEFKTLLGLPRLGIGALWSLARLVTGLRHRAFGWHDPDGAIPLRTNPGRYWTEVGYLLGLHQACARLAPRGRWPGAERRVPATSVDFPRTDPASWRPRG